MPGTCGFFCSLVLGVHTDCFRLADAIDRDERPTPQYLQKLLFALRVLPQFGQRSACGDRIACDTLGLPQRLQNFALTEKVAPQPVQIIGLSIVVGVHEFGAKVVRRPWAANSGIHLVRTVLGLKIPQFGFENLELAFRKQCGSTQYG